VQKNRSRRRARRVVHYATGYGIRVCVDRGHLVVEGGIGRDRRSARFNRATGGLSRLVLVGSTGYVSVDAAWWMADTGCALIQLDHTGRVLATSAVMGSDYPALRRAQALAATRPIGLEISRRLLAVKLAGQCQIADTLDADATRRIADLAHSLEACEQLDELRLVEAQAASAYWGAWRGVRAEFITRDAGRVPGHWTRFSQRISALTGSPRLATDPINAILNYLYALLEAESRIALTAVGLDPGVGILHADQRARDSLALDLMETARPAVDRYVLDLVAVRPLRANEFAETSSGQCRIMPSLARQLAFTTSTWSDEVAPHAEFVAKLLAANTGLTAPPTLLTGDNSRAARPAGSRTRSHQAPKPTEPVQVCCDCGREIRAGQRRCPDCHSAANAQRMSAVGRQEILRRNTLGQHPTQAPGVRERIAAKQREHWQARRAMPPPSGFTGQPSEFQRLILPKLAGIKPANLARATGLSAGYCAQIRDGLRVPNVRRWAAFQLAGLQLADDAAVQAPGHDEPDHVRPAQRRGTKLAGRTHVR
jgi:CRISPR-associated endonuclease Cas1